MVPQDLGPLLVPIDCGDLSGGDRRKRKQEGGTGHGFNIADTGDRAQIAILPIGEIVLALDLPKEIEQRLEIMASRAGRSKEAWAADALVEFLEPAGSGSR